MSQYPRQSSRLEPPASADAERALRQARRIFHRTLAGWASDVLMLRRADLLRPTWTPSGRDEDTWSMAA